MLDDDKRTEYFLTKKRKVNNFKSSTKLIEPIGKSWWSKKWIELFQTLDSGNRISQGKYNAKIGQVLYLKVQKGFAIAKVQDNKPLPYRVRIELKKIPEDIWTEVLNDIANDTYATAKILAEQIPKKISEFFEKYNYSLLPRIDDDLKAGCTCPDWANPCKHTAAAFYIFAQLLDEDPFTLFKIRGKTKVEILAIIREIRSNYTKENVMQNEESISSKEIDLLQFKNEIDNSNVKEEGLNILDNLEESPIFIQGQSLNTLFRNGYSIAKNIATKKLEELKEKEKQRN